jgi:hypothetical protein
MRDLMNCRRGSVAFATVAALVPLIGVVALGAETATWYVTKQHAQNAADAAAYSGGFTLACSISGSTNCDTAQTYVYRGKEFAAQNGFCNATDTTSYPGSTCSTLPSGISRTVQVASLTSWKGNAGNFVQATVSQQQPTYLASVLGLSTVNIVGQATVKIEKPQQVCALGLGPNSNALTIGGTSNITGTGCAMMSDNTVKYNSTPTFSGSGWSVDGVGGCIASTGHCAISVPYNYNMLPATNPLSVLNGESFNSRTGPVTTPCGGGGIVTNGKTCSLSPNSASGVYSGLTVNSGGTLTLAAGTYFFYNAAINFSGTVSGTGVTFVLLGDSSLTINGGTVNLSAPATNSFSSDLNGVLIDDQAPNKSSNAVTVNGGGTVALGGAMYFPNVNVTWSGNVQNTNTACSEVVANTITINGNAYMDSKDCVPATISHTQVVTLVQ